IAWASGYYLPAILTAPIARDLSLESAYVFGGLSGGLVIAGLLGPRVGHVIDTFGGRGLLAISKLVFASGLLLLSLPIRPVLLDRRVGRSWNCDGDGPLRSSLCHADPHLRRRSATADHRHHLDRGVRQHGGLAHFDLTRFRTGLAGRLPDLGRCSPCIGAAT